MNEQQLKLDFSEVYPHLSDYLTIYLTYDTIYVLFIPRDIFNNIDAFAVDSLSPYSVNSMSVTSLGVRISLVKD